MPQDYQPPPPLQTAHSILQTLLPPPNPKSPTSLFEPMPSYLIWIKLGIIRMDSKNPFPMVRKRLFLSTLPTPIVIFYTFNVLCLGEKKDQFDQSLFIIVMLSIQATSWWISLTPCHRVVQHRSKLFDPTARCQPRLPELIPFACVWIISLFPIHVTERLLNIVIVPASEFLWQFIPYTDRPLCEKVTSDPI